MKKTLLWTLGALLVALNFASANVASAQNTSTDESKKRLIEQKIKLVEMLANSPAAKSSAYGRDAETPNLLAQSKGAIESARSALNENRYDDAARLLDQALKSVSSASRRVSTGSTLSDSVQRKTLQDLTEQVATYRAALNELAGVVKTAADANDLLARLDNLSKDAAQLDAGGRLGEANKKMSEAYKLAVEGIARLRQGQEVIMSLKFDSPAEEYVYEQKRLASNEIMVDMMIAEGKADSQKRLLIDRYINESRRLKGEAEAAAQAGKLKDAVSLMEIATGQLVRALQTMGVAVF